MKAADLSEEATLIPQAGTQDSLPQLLSMTKSSHEPVFIYDRKNRFYGVFWPYFAVFHRKPVIEAKAAHLIGPAVHLTNQTSVFRIVDHMLSLRLYTLPVLTSDSEISAIVTAKKIIRFFLLDDRWKADFLKQVKIRPLLTVNKNDKIRQIFPLMRRHNLSRAAVVNSQGHLQGIISRRDIYLALAWPGENSRMKSKGNRTKQLLFDRDWPDKLDHYVRNLMSGEVRKIEQNGGIVDALKMLLQGNGGPLAGLSADKAGGVGSVVITDRNNKPLGVISIRSALLAIQKLEIIEQVPVSIVDKNRIFGFFRLNEIEKLLGRYGAKIDKINPLSRMEIVIEAAKNPLGKIRMFLMTMKSIFIKGKSIVVKAQGHSVRKTINQLVDKSMKKLHFS